MPDSEVGRRTEAETRLFYRSCEIPAKFVGKIDATKCARPRGNFPSLAGIQGWADPRCKKPHFRRRIIVRTWTRGILSGLSALFAGCERLPQAPESVIPPSAATHAATPAPPTGVTETATFALG
jgi:hypothetical protein